MAEAVIHVLVFHLDHFVSFSKLEIYANCVWSHEKFGGKIISFLKNSRFTNVKNSFLKGITRIIAWVFLPCTINRFEANQVESMTVFT